MINDFYITADDIIDPDNEQFSLYDYKLTGQILSQASSVTGVIRAIENFNDGKPKNKRMVYFVMLKGSFSPIQAVKTKFIDEEDKHAIIYGYNMSNGVYFSKTPNDKIKYMEGISTYMVKVDQISGVNFGSFDEWDCRFLLEDPDATVISGEKMAMLISEELSLWNSSVASGEYRHAINHFCIFMKKHKINDYDFNFNSVAFNKYIALCGAYMNLIKDIVGRHDDPTINKLDPKVPNKVYFFKDKEAMEEFVKEAEHTRMHVTVNNTFYDEDIVLFKQILTKS